MAIAVNGGHVSRAIDFYNDRDSMYLAIGGTQPWSEEPTPDLPDLSDFKLRGIIALKKVNVNRVDLVIPSPTGDITYRDQTWERIVDKVTSTVGEGGITLGSTIIPVTEASTAFAPGKKIRIANMYDATITSVSGSTVTVDTPSPEVISAGATILAGALVEGAKYVYVEGILEYDTFPVGTYRQIGLCTGVIPKSGITDVSILRSAAYSPTGRDEYEDVGVLEVLDNRYPTSRDASMRELISFIIEF